MMVFTRTLRIGLLMACATLAACASPDPVAYRGLASSSYLQTNAGDRSGRVPFRYGSGVNWRSYDALILDPVAVYRGPDAQFGEMSDDDKARLAAFMQRQFTEKLGQVFRLANTPRPGTLRVRLTLTGAETNTPVLTTLTRFDLAGGLYNGVQAARGREGMMSGAVFYAVEIYDAAANTLLDAAIYKQYPGAYNIGASLGSLSAAETGIEKGAASLAAQLASPSP